MERENSNESSVTKKTYTCSDCDKAFAKQSTLVNHKRTHTGSDLYFTISEPSHLSIKKIRFFIFNNYDLHISIIFWMFICNPQWWVFPVLNLGHSKILSKWTFEHLWSLEARFHCRSWYKQNFWFWTVVLATLREFLAFVYVQGFMRVFYKL